MPRKAKISKDELIRWQKKLHTYNAIGEKFGITAQAVYWNRKKYGIPLLPRAQRIPKDELIRLQKQLHTDEAIGKEFGITRQRVHQLRNKYGIPAEFEWRFRNPPQIPKNEFIKLQKTLRTDKAIGEKYGVSETTARYIRKKYGIPAMLPDNTKRNAKIISLFKQGMTGTAIAKRFKLSVSYVCKIIERQDMEGKNQHLKNYCQQTKNHGHDHQR